MVSRRKKSTTFPVTTTAFVVFSLLLCGSSAVHGEDARRSSNRTHVVKRGETLSEIAVLHGLRVDDLAVANKLNPERPISIGDSLKIPRRDGPRYHVVRSGETAVKVAKAEGCTLVELRQYNGLRKSARLRAGQILKIPDPAPTQPESRGRKRTHTVKNGETLNTIAHQYGLGTKILQRANKIRSPQSLRPGRVLVIPDPAPRKAKGKARLRPLQQTRRISGERKGSAVLHRVMDGQSWRLIAKSYRKSIKRLRAANPKLGSRLNAGSIVRIPGAPGPVSVPVGNCGYPGIRFERVEKKQTIRLLRCNGRINPNGRRQLSLVAARRGKTPKRLLDAGLLRRLQVVADEFPGHVFRVVSGYRAPAGERGSSRHNYGQALDFSLRGVSNRVLYDFCRTLPQTGCGFYPNSTFIHLDARDESVSWVDMSAPGQAPQYTPRAPDGEPTIPGPAKAD